MALHPPWDGSGKAAADCGVACSHSTMLPCPVPCPWLGADGREGMEVVAEKGGGGNGPIRRC